MQQLLDHQGRSVRLTDERLAHILQRPEMAAMETPITHTLREPQLVVRSRSDPQVVLFYSWQPQTIVGGKWLCSVVKYSTHDAFIITAYLTDRPKAGEQLWPRT